MISITSSFEHYEIRFDSINLLTTFSVGTVQPERSRKYPRTPTITRTTKTIVITGKATIATP